MIRFGFSAMDGVACGIKIYAPQANFTEMTEEEIKAIKAVRKELESKKKTGN